MFMKFSAVSMEFVMKHIRAFLFLAILVIASLACGLFGGGGGGSEDVISPGIESPSEGVSPSSGSEGDEDVHENEFPLPPNVENYMDLGTAGINFQTTMSLDEVVNFYRGAFEDAGYDERDITTVVNDTTFSIVWDGHPSGQAIVVQGVDLGDGTVNVNVRFEDV
jgi:hypothetical protein